jgi:ribosomal protein L11 methyltransferase
MLELFPGGFEEVLREGEVELAAYTEPGGEERLWSAFGPGRSENVGEGWEERWRAFHRPVRIGPLWIGPSWEAAPAGATPVVIDPGRAFGTGGHPTTRLTLELLLELPRGSLLDVGCGSGVLAVAAARLGFSPVLAVDADPNAVEVTRTNAAANGAAVEALVADLAVDALPRTDAAVANINAETIERSASRFTAARVVTSGYLEPDRPRLHGYRPVERRSAGGWAADLHLRAV